MNLDEMKVAIGEKLREAREAKGLRLEDVNLKTGMSVANLSHMENGRCNSCVDTYDRYAAFLELKFTMDVVKEG